MFMSDNCACQIYSLWYKGHFNGESIHVSAVCINQANAESAQMYNFFLFA